MPVVGSMFSHHQCTDGTKSNWNIFFSSDLEKNRLFLKELYNKYPEEIKRVNYYNRVSRLKQILSFEEYSFVQLTFFVTYVIDNNKFKKKRNLLDKIDEARLANYIQLPEDLLEKQKKELNMFTNINAKLLEPYLNDSSLIISNFDRMCLRTRIIDSLDTKSDLSILSSFLSFQMRVQTEYTIDTMYTIDTLYTIGTQYSIDTQYSNDTQYKNTTQSVNHQLETLPISATTLLTEPDSGSTSKPIKPLKPPLIKRPTLYTIRPNNNTKQAWHKIFFSKVIKFAEKHNLLMSYVLLIAFIIFMGFSLKQLNVFEFSTSKIIIKSATMYSSVTDVIKYSISDYLKQNFIQIFSLLLSTIMIIVLALYYFKGNNLNDKSFKNFNRKQSKNIFSKKNLHEKTLKRLPSRELHYDFACKIMDNNVNKQVETVNRKSFKKIRIDSNIKGKHSPNSKQMSKADTMNQKVTSMLMNNSSLWS